jgi:hypothetical protein
MNHADPDMIRTSAAHPTDRISAAVVVKSLILKPWHALFGALASGLPLPNRTQAGHGPVPRGKH